MPEHRFGRAPIGPGDITGDVERAGAGGCRAVVADEEIPARVVGEPRESKNRSTSSIGLMGFAVMTFLATNV